MKTIKHSYKGFDFIETEYGIRVMTLTKDSFSYPNKTWVATIRDKDKRLSFCHGYYPKHPIGNKLRKYALKIGYSAF